MFQLQTTAVLVSFVLNGLILFSLVWEKKKTFFKLVLVTVPYSISKQYHAEELLLKYTTFMWNIRFDYYF